METTQTYHHEAGPRDWGAPVALDATFMFDPMHFPFPVSPLTDTAMSPAFSGGFTRALHELNIPLKAMHVLSRNMHHFEYYELARPSSEEEGRRMGELAEASLKPAVGRLLDDWRTIHWPAAQVDIARLREMDVDSPPPVKVAELIDELGRIHLNEWTIHFRIAIPMMVGMQLFDEFYAEVFGDDEGEGHVLLTGVESESVKAGLGLSNLAARATSLGLAPLFRETPFHELLATLERTDAGRRFIADLRAYLDEYGLRQDLFDYQTPTWH